MGTRVRFRDLSDSERAIICNGCGRKGGVVPVPDFIFTASCDHHDFNYWLGYREEDRFRADVQFYVAMVEDANRAAWWKRGWYRILAWTYYRAVRSWGACAFHFGDHERTREDLDEEIALNGKG